MSGLCTAVQGDRVVGVGGWGGGAGDPGGRGGAGMYSAIKPCRVSRVAMQRAVYCVSVTRVSLCETLQVRACVCVHDHEPQ